jgi:hypothetical protein
MIYAKIEQYRKQLIFLPSHNQMLLEGYLVSREIREKLQRSSTTNAPAAATKMSGEYVKSGLYCTIPNDS